MGSRNPEGMQPSFPKLHLSIQALLRWGSICRLIPCPFFGYPVLRLGVDNQKVGYRKQGNAISLQVACPGPDVFELAILLYEELAMQGPFDSAMWGTLQGTGSRNTCMLAEFMVGRCCGAALRVHDFKGLMAAGTQQFVPHRAELV